MDIKEYIVDMPVMICHYWKEPKEIDVKLEQSILEFGIIAPLFVRHHENSYQVYLGQERLKVAIRLGIEKIPVIIRDLTDDEIIIIRVEANLVHKGFKEMKPSEAAEVIYEYHNRLKAQGRRSDLLNEIRTLVSYLDNEENNLTFCPLDKKLNSGIQTSKEFGLSPRTISRYLRVYHVDKILKVALDKEKISLRSIVELSYLRKEEQQQVGTLIFAENYNISLAVSSYLRKFSKQEELDAKSIKEICELKGKKQEGFPHMKKIYDKYRLWRFSKDEVINIVDKALSKYLEKVIN